MKAAPYTALYSILHGEVLPFAEGLLESQLGNLVQLMDGMYEGRSVHLSRIASNVTARVTNGSVGVRLNRFLENPKVAVRGMYEAIARDLVRRAAAVGTLVIIVDGTKVRFSAQRVMVSLAYQGRALPLIWTWLPYAKGHSLTATRMSRGLWKLVRIEYGCQSK